MMFRKLLLLFALFITSLIVNSCVTSSGITSSEVNAVPYNSKTGSTDIMSGKYYMKVHGIKRDFILTLPENYDSTKSYPLVLAWHGMGGYAESVAVGGDLFIKKSYFGLLEASNNQAVFIAGQGLLLPSRGTNANTGWANEKGRDIAFVESLITWAESNLSIDNSRIFSIGFSMGGMFSNMVACKFGNRIRAIATISGHVRFPRMYDPYKQCKGDKVPAWIIHGKNDRTLLYASGEKTRDFFATINECSDTYTEDTPYDCVRFNGCAEGYPVVWCSHQGGHIIPPYVGKEVWKFFSQF